MSLLLLNQQHILIEDEVTLSKLLSQDRKDEIQRTLLIFKYYFRRKICQQVKKY